MSADRPHAPRAAVAFTRVLRGAGLDVSAADGATFARALGEIRVDRGAEVYWAGRATFVRRPEDTPAYDRAFSAFWGDRAERVLDAVPPPTAVLVDDPDPDDPDDPDEADEADDAEGAQLSDDHVQRVRWSAAEVLRQRDFADYSPEEHAHARRLMDDVRLHAARRRSRRLDRTRSRGRPDLRRTVRRVLRSGGEPAPPVRRAPGTRPRRVVLLLDVSGSMEPYARSLLRFVHASVVGGARVEAFALGTRLTRLTRELSGRDPDAALRAATGRVVDWSGGTRLGAGLRRFNDEWGVRGLARGSVVVILSDGWDRGEPDLLGEQMARIARVAHRVVWVNPLRASPGYAPVARGMAAALPHVDEFVDGHSLAALESLAALVADEPRRPARRRGTRPGGDARA